MLRAIRAIAAGAILLVAIGGCTDTRVEEPDPAAVPSGEPVAQGGDPIGPVTVLGSGQTLELGWRYLFYESADGQCTELQLTEVITAGCGPDLLPAEGEAFGSVSVGEPLEGGETPVDGIVSDETFTVWLIDEQTGRVPATLMPLDEAGLEGQAFVGVMPADVTLTHIQAVAMSGEVLETFEVH